MWRLSAGRRIAEWSRKQGNSSNTSIGALILMKGKGEEEEEEEEEEEKEEEELREGRATREKEGEEHV